jgi:hypothetical protein
MVWSVDWTMPTEMVTRLSTLITPYNSTVDADEMSMKQR